MGDKARLDQGTSILVLEAKAHLFPVNFLCMFIPKHEKIEMVGWPTTEILDPPIYRQYNHPPLIPPNIPMFGYC